MNRIDELQEKYPMIPRGVIVKWEVWSRGIKDSEVVDKVSTYDRGGFFASRDQDVTMADIAKKRPESVKPGFVLRAPGFVLKSGQPVAVTRSTTSPYEVREESGGYALYGGGEKIEDIFFVNPKHWQDAPEKEPRTSRGNPVTSFVNLSRRCFQIAPVRHCEYFITGEQCKFCNYNYTQQDASCAGADRPVTANPEETVEAYRIIASEMPPLVEGQLQMGGFSNSDLEARKLLQFVERIASATPYLPNITLRTQPMSRQMMGRLKDAGTGAVSFNLEVWDPEIFAEVCPGKAKYRGRERYLEAYQEAVEVFGWGSVGCDFVAGVTLQPANGHKTWQEARDSHAEGNDWLIEHGVMPVFMPLRLGVGSIYGDDPSSRARIAPTECFLEVALAHHKTMMETGMYEKLNKLMYCPLCCVGGVYVGDLGMYALAGDIGKWASKAGIPDDANWIARFIESQKEPAKAN